MWEKDSTIDLTSLTFELSKNSNLYSKYLDLYIKYKVKRHKMKSIVEKVEVDTVKYYSGKRQVNGKAFPERLIREDLKTYCRADDNLQDARQKLEAVEITVELLTKILDMIKNRSFEIRSIIDLKKIENGL